MDPAAQPAAPQAPAPAQNADPPPLQFLDLHDKHGPFQENDNANWSIRDPTITVAKVNSKAQLAAHFSLEVKPHPIYSRGDNKTWPHARYIEMVRLKYQVADNEYVLFHPETDEDETLKLTSTAKTSTTFGGSVGVSGIPPVPNANMNISIVRGGTVVAENDNVSSWACNAGYEPSTNDPPYKFVWEWISKLDTPTVPDSAFRGKKFTMKVTRIFDMEAFLLPGNEQLRTPDELQKAKDVMKKNLCFEFEVEIMVRELGKGGLRARLQKLTHRLRPQPQPRDAYKPDINVGVPLPKMEAKSFTIPPNGPPDVTPEDLGDIEDKINLGTGYTASLQDAKKQITSQFLQTGLLASHIFTYGPGQSVPDQGHPIKATFVTKNW